MKFLSTIVLFAALIFTAPRANAAAFPYITLNSKTNRVSDNGTNLTYNGSALSGSGGTAGTLVTNGATASAGDLVAYGTAITNVAKATSAQVGTAVSGADLSLNSIATTNGIVNYSSIPTNGLVTWYHADDMVGVSGSSPTNWPDRISGYNATATTNANGPQLIRGAFGSHAVSRTIYSANHFWTIPTNVTLVSTNMTLAIIARTSLSGTVQCLMSITNTGVIWQLLAFPTTGQVRFYDGNNRDSGLYPHEGFNLYVARASNTGVQQNVGKRYSYDTTVPTTATKQGGTIGAYNGTTSPFFGDIAEVFIYNRVLEDSEVDQLNTYGQREYETDNPESSRLMILGNSITAGYGLVTTEATLHLNVGRKLPREFHVINLAETSIQTTQMWANISTFQGLKKASTNNIAFVWEVRNDICNGGANTNQALANLTNLCSALMTNGWITVVGTVLPSSTLSNNDRQAMNTNILAMVGWGMASAVVNFGTDTRLVTGTNFTSGASPDSVHLTTAGQYYAAQDILAVLSALKLY